LVPGSAGAESRLILNLGKNEKREGIQMKAELQNMKWAAATREGGGGRGEVLAVREVMIDDARHCWRGWHLSFSEPIFSSM
jgi:hypothetical protein